METKHNPLKCHFCPRRVQRKRTKGWRMPENTVYVGRPSKWGNPFPVGKEMHLGLILNHELSIGLFKTHLNFDGNYLIALAKKELKGKNLACWCSLNERCHADILLEIANEHETV